MSIKIENLLGYWRFEETVYNGTTDEVDNSALESNKGTTLNAVSTANGKINRGVELAGTGYIDIDRSDLRFEFDSTTSFSYGAWFKTSSGTEQLLLGKQNYGARPTWAVMTQTNGTLRNINQSSGGDGPDLRTNEAYNDGNWHLFVSTSDRDNNIMRLYVDGTERKNGVIPSGASYVSPGTLLRLGCVSTTRYLTGSLDEGFIAQSVLDSTQVSYLWNDSTGRKLISDLSYFSQSSVVSDSSAISYVDLDSIVDTIQNDSANTYFDSTSKIGRVQVYYQHQDNRQVRRLIHDSTSSYQANVSWSDFARDGVWEKSRVRVFDFDEAENTLERPILETLGEDITHSDGTMFLNT